MLIQISMDKNFPKNIIEFINQSIAIIARTKKPVDESKLRLNLILEYHHSLTDLKAEMLDEFCKALISSSLLNLFDIKSIQINFQNIPENIAITMLCDKKFVELLNDETIKKLLIVSHSVILHALPESHIQERLKHLKTNNNNNNQLYSHSCTANAIMWLLYKIGKISKTALNPLTELQIYSFIWEAPGKPANPKKIVDYFNLINIPLSGIVIKNTVELYLKSYSHLNSAFTLFKNSLGHSKLKFIDKIDDYDLTDDKLLLIITANNDGSTHTIFCRKTKNDKIKIYDNGQQNLITKFDDFKKIMEKKNGVGVLFEINRVSYQNKSVKELSPNYKMSN